MGFAQSKDWHEAFATAQDHIRHVLGKLFLPLVLVRVLGRTIGTLNYEHVHFTIGEFSRFQKTIFFARVIASVQNFDPIYLNQKHGGSENVTRPESRKLDSTHLNLLMIVDQLDLIQRILNIFLVEELFVTRRNPTDFDKIVQHKVVDRLCGVSHENFPIKLGFLDKVG